jgi:dihydrofolate reductase
MVNNIKINIVVAMDADRGVGKNDRIPWHIREDLVRLRNLTKEKYVILGRKTYESMVWYYDKSGKKMPGKEYVVITRDMEYKPKREDAAAMHSIDEALAYVAGKSDEVFVIGGAKIFAQTLGMADRLYLTIVEGTYDCDTFFPDYSGFKKVVSEEEKESEGVRYRFVELEREVF